jgi:peptide/nickel transport system permease protein
MNTGMRAANSAWWRRFARNRTAIVGCVLLLLLLGAAIAAPLISPHAPGKVNAREALASSSGDHWLGTDNLGRDMLSRLIWGARWSLGTSIVAGLAISFIGTAIGLIAGFARGWIDEILMRIVDVLLALPGIVVALAVVGMRGPGLSNVMIAIIGIWWVDYARLIRSTVLRVREEEYILAARSFGTPPLSMLRKHVLPNVLPTSIVLTSMNIGSLLLALAGLSFLGFGAQPPTPEWGTMLENGRPFFQRAPQLMIYPGLAITITAVAFNLVGDGLRDALDPRLRHE